MWTQFWDMHSGGGQKEDYSQIFIEAPESEAKVIFYNRFGHSPERVTCTCCGEDYAIHEKETLQQATACERGCAYGDNGYIEKSGESYKDFTKFEKFEEMMEDLGDGTRHIKNKKFNFLFIPKEAIKDEERQGSVPAQGYLWVD